MSGLPRIGVISVVVGVAILGGCGRSDPSFVGFTFCSDARFLLGAYSRSGHSFIYKISIDTGKATRLTHATDGFEGVPSLSPNGKRIVYSYSRGHDAHSRIIMSNVDGSSSRPWATSDVSDFRPVFSTDGNKIIFARSGYYGSYSPIAQAKHHEWNFYMGDLNGTNIRQLTNEDFYMVSRASLSPDGKSMMFVDVMTDMQGDVIAIYSLEQPASPRRVLKPHVAGEPETGGTYGDAMFLADGKSILFLAASNGARAFDYDVYRLDLRTQHLEKLTKANGFSYALAASRDGRVAVFVRHNPEWNGKDSEIMLLDLTSHKLTPLKVSGLN